MRPLSRSIGALLVALVLASCVNPALTRRYDSATWQINPDTADPLADVSVFILDPSQESAKATLLALTERGQAAFVAALAEKSQSSQSFMEALGSSIGKKASPGLVTDLNKFKRRIVLSAERTGASQYRPEDRIHAIRCTFADLSANTEFVSWDRFSTKYETVDLGKVTLTQNAGIDVAVKATSAEDSGDPVERGFTTTNSRNLVEEVSLRQRYVALSGILRKHSATVIQEGVVGIDLTGNAFIDVELKLPASPPQPFIKIIAFKKDGDWVPQEKIDISRSLIRFPRVEYDENGNAASVVGRMSCNYVVRKVNVSDGRTILEGDDAAIYVMGETAGRTDIEFVPRDALDFKIWYIETTNANAIDEAVWIDGPWDRSVLNFASYEEAIAFTQWARDYASTKPGDVKIGNQTLFFYSSAGEQPLQHTDAAGLVIKVRNP